VSDDQTVDVYVVDTGVEDDPSFAFPVSYDYSYYDVGNVHSSDCNGHATHVSGLIASKIYGVSPWNVQIHSVKALDCQGKGDFASLTAAFLWIKQHRSLTRRSIINLSWDPTEVKAPL
jgi:subtilisin family serine protease